MRRSLTDVAKERLHRWNEVLSPKAKVKILFSTYTIATKISTIYQVQFPQELYWWECAEMARRLLLVGVFVDVEPGTCMQIALGIIVCAIFLLLQLQAQPFKNQSDDFLATASSFGLLMIFVCASYYKYSALTDSAEVQEKMSQEQREDYTMPSVLLSVVLICSVLSSVVAAGLVACMQVAEQARVNAKRRRLKYVDSHKWVELEPLLDRQAFHLFLSHAWPAAQDVMRIVKERFAEALPSCRVFLDVDNLMSGSGVTEVDKSECIVVFCTNSYFDKKNSMKELYRAVTQRRPILAMLEPDATQDGGLGRKAVEDLLLDGRIDRQFKLRHKWSEWKEEGELLPAAFEHAPDGAEVAAALFATEPVEWSRLPHFQDVTIRLLAQKGVLQGKHGDLYLQGEMATRRYVLPEPFKGRKFHLFCSVFNQGAAEVATELQRSGLVIKSKLDWTAEYEMLRECDHMLVLLDGRTWTSGKTTAELVKHIEQAMQLGVHICCVHEFPSVVGPPRHACEFALMFTDRWTPSHLTSGTSNLYKEIALALKGAEWRKPSLAALAMKLANGGAERNPIALPAIAPEALHEEHEVHPQPLPPKSQFAQSDVRKVVTFESLWV